MTLQRCFPSTLYVSCPLLLLSPLLKRLIIKQGYTPALEGRPREAAVDRRQSTSSYSPGSPADASTDNPLIRHTSGALLLCTTSTRLPAARPSSVTQYFRFLKGGGGGRHRILNELILPLAVLWSDILIKVMQMEA